jgi:hypothetical protein
MNLEELRANWNELGSADLFSAILTVPEYKGNRWRVEEFFRTGQRRVGPARADWRPAWITGLAGRNAGRRQSSMLEIRLPRSRRCQEIGSARVSVLNHETT